MRVLPQRHLLEEIRLAQIDDAVVLPAAYIDTGPTFPLSSAVNLNTAMGRLKSMSITQVATTLTGSKCTSVLTG